MVVWPGLVIRHAVPAWRAGQRRLPRLGYIAVSAALIVFFFAVFVHTPQVCNKPIWSDAGPSRREVYVARSAWASASAERVLAWANPATNRAPVGRTAKNEKSPSWVSGAASGKRAR